MARRRILTLALLSCTAVSAHASPRTDPTTGRAVFTGATTPHATSIGLDPAALGLGQFDEIYVAITGVLDQLDIDLDPYTGAGLSAPGARVRDVELAPGAMLAFIYHFASNITLGLEARTTPTETFPSGKDALRYHTLGDGERAWAGSAGVSFKATGGLFFGAGVSHQNTFLRLRYARDTSLELGGLCGGAACGLGNPLATEQYDVDVRSDALSTKNLRVNIGAIYELSRDLWIAVAYHTPPGFSVQSELRGHVTIDRAPRDIERDGGESAVLRGQALVEIQLPASVDAELRARLPMQLDLHVGGRWEDLSRLSAYDVRMFGTTLPGNNIPEWTVRPRGMRDAFAAWVGVEQIETGGRLLLGGRVGVETAAVSLGKLSPLTVAPRSFSLDAGAQLRLSRALSAQLSYGLQYFPTVHAQTSAFDPQDRITCGNTPDYSTSECQAVRAGYAIAPAAGSYERLQHAVRIGLRYELF